MRYLQQNLSRLLISNIGIVGYLVTGNGNIALCPTTYRRIVNKEEAILLIFGMEGQTKQTSFVSCRINERYDVQEGGWAALPIFKDHNFAGFLDNEQSPTAVARVGNINRRIESITNKFE